MADPSSYRNQLKRLMHIPRKRSDSPNRRTWALKSDEDKSPVTLPTEMVEVEGKRTDLWGAAYEQIQKEAPKLLVVYKKYLLAPDQGMSST